MILKRPGAAFLVIAHCHSPRYLRPLMKSKLVVMMVISAGWFGAGCRDSSTPPVPSGGTTPSPTAESELQKAAAETAQRAAAEAQKQAQALSAEAQKQAAEAAAAAQNQAAAAQKEARTAVQGMGADLTASLQSSSDSLLKNIGTDLGAKISQLGASLKTNEAVKAQLTTAVKALMGKKDADAVTSVGQVKQSSLTPEQSVLAKDVYNATAALVTQRNFSSLDGMNNEVSSLVNSVWKGNYTEAMPPLQKIWTQAKLTEDQKNLLGKTFDQYMPGWRNSAGTLQKGLDGLKSLSK
jgi:vacuolar-type H+-ATPase subunit E/Vma4